MDETCIKDWSTAPTSYRDQLIATVGVRDPVEVLAETPSRVRALTAASSAEQIGRRPEPSEWSAEEIVGHLLDDEIIFAFRLRLGLTGDDPRYAGTDPDRWAALAKPPFALLLKMWELLREYNVVTIRALSPEDWQLAGIHVEQGEETVEMTIRKTAGHDLIHLDQMARTLEG